MNKIIPHTTNFSKFIEQYANHPHYRAPRGTHLNALSWQTEAPLRMLLNNLDMDVAENPDQLVVYGGTGQAARSRKDLLKIIQCLLVLKEDESLLIQSGRPVGIIPTHPMAPRVLIANSNLVPAWSNWEHFQMLKDKGLMMYGQMTAGSWIYIGSQGILQGTYETFMACGQGDLKYKLLVSGGLGGMGGAQPLAATFAGATFLGADVDEDRIAKRIQTGYLDKMTHSIDQAIDWALDAKVKGESISIGWVGDIGDLLERLIQRNITPEVLTDQTSAHDPVHGYVPNGLNIQEAKNLRIQDPSAYKKKSLASMARHVSFMLELKKRGSITFDYGNNLREYAKEGGCSNSFDIKGFVPEYIRPLFCEGKGPFRWVALSGDPEDIFKTDAALLKAFPENTHLANWLKKAGEKIQFQGLPSRICWLGLGERKKAGLLLNDMVKNGQLSGPIIIGRDHLDCGSVASPNRETEGMLDGSDAVSDWALLNLLGNTSGGATWVSFHHGGGVGMGYSQHAGMVVLADGTERAEQCISRVLHIDPAMGIFRHKDAGYSIAREMSHKFGLDLPQGL